MGLHIFLPILLFCTPLQTYLPPEAGTQHTQRLVWWPQTAKRSLMYI